MTPRQEKTPEHREEKEMETERIVDTPLGAARVAWRNAEAERGDGSEESLSPLEAAVAAAVVKDRTQRVPAFFRRFDTHMENKLGEWVPAITMPFLGARKKCRCGEKFWTLDGYRGHYALKHILDPEPDR